MAKGGARAFSGPAPDPSALRRDRDGASWTILPASGRKGDTPDWPLRLHVDVARDDEKAQEWAKQHDDREAELWARQWRRPQAVQWERNGQEEEVALFVRTLADAEAPGASMACRTLVKQLQDTLGLSLPGLLRLRWKIESATPEQEGQSGRPSAPAAASTRSRFKVVSGGGS